MAEIITSLQNPGIRRLMLLMGKSKERRRQDSIIIEGYREVSRAIQSGFRVLEIYRSPELDHLKRGEELKSGLPDARLIDVSQQVFAKMAYREGSDGIIAIANPRHLRLDELKLPLNPLLIILESVEKPGNLGAVMRTADAAGADAVIICDPLTDLYNPNTIRSSVGCIFSVPLVAATTIEVQHWLTHHQIPACAAALISHAVQYHNVSYLGPTAFVMGTEATGLSRSWLDYCKTCVIIPMNGIADSLNVSVSTAILVYEALRQRQKS